MHLVFDFFMKSSWLSHPSDRSIIIIIQKSETETGICSGLQVHRNWLCIGLQVHRNRHMFRAAELQAPGTWFPYPVPIDEIKFFRREAVREDDLRRKAVVSAWFRAQLIVLLLVLFSCSGESGTGQDAASSANRDESLDAGERGAPAGESAAGKSPAGAAGNRIIGAVSDTKPAETGAVSIRGSGRLEFDPAAVESVRPDLFRDGYFSVFDVLVHLDQRGEVDLEYHFDRSMNTHIIDSLNGKPYWWYTAHYDGGWRENNLFRMDHFPYKDSMTIQVMQVAENRLEELYDVFHSEVARGEENEGQIIVPEVTFEGPGVSLTFNDVPVSAHNLRSDIFREGVVTAVDVVMALGDRGELSYDLRWYESIGVAVVQNYFVDRIDEAAAQGRCGFVYESGSRAHDGFRGNHIHLPPDTRVLNSPEYVSFFWICI
jgi:hypothetical protein